MAWWKFGLGALALSVMACGSNTETETPAAGGNGGSGASTGAAGATGGTGGSAGGPTVDGCEEGTAIAGSETITITHGGMERSYNLHLPTGYDGSPVPLVLNFHGFTSQASEQEAFSAMTPLADSEGFAVAYPDGIGSSWNGGALCCGQAAEDMIDDVDFTRQIVADIASRACIDNKRVYSTGMSNGGFMSHRLACEASDLIAAIAPVDGVLGVPAAECTPERNVPIVHFYGTDDPLVLIDFANQTNDFWTGQYNCSDAMPEVTTQQGAATCQTWDECDGGAVVTFCTIEGMGHCWPGQSFCPAGLGESNVDLSANEHMWAFFQQFTLE